MLHLENEKTELDAKISIESPDQIEAFLNQEETMLKEMTDKIVGFRRQRGCMPKRHR